MNRQDSLGNHSLRWLKYLLALGGVAVLALAWSITTLGSTDSQHIKALPFFVTAAFIGLVVVYERDRRRLELIGGLGITLAAYFIMFSAVPIVDVIESHPLTHHEAWWTAGWLSLLGVVCLYVGYQAVLALETPQFRHTKREWSSSRAMLSATLLMLVALLALATLILMVGGPGAYLSVFRQRTLYLRGAVPLILGVGLAIPACLIMAGRSLRIRSAGAATHLLVLWLPITLLTVGTLGARFRVAIVLLALMAIYHLGYRRINPAVLTIVVVMMLMAFVVYAVQRNFVGSQQVAPRVNLENVYERYLTTHDSVGEFREFLRVVESAPTELEFQGGRTFLSIVPGSDHPTGGQLYSSHFFGKLYAAGTSISPSLPGEFYMNFGAPGMALGMFFFGCLVGVIESYFRHRRHNIGALLIYAFSSFSLAMMLRGDFTSMTIYYLAGVIPLIVAVRFCEFDRVHVLESPMHSEEQ